MTSAHDERRARLGSVSRALAAQKGKGKLLEEIAWPRAVEERFLAGKGGEEPVVEYATDRDGLNRHVASLRSILASIDGDDALAEYLRRVVSSQIDGHELMLAIGTRRFHAISVELYGSSKTPFFGGPLRNIDLAEHLIRRLAVHGWDEAEDPEEPLLDAPAMVELLRARIEEQRPSLAIEVVLDERATAKVVAGMSRVRVRPDATFARWEAEGLYHHEIETHALSAHNGARQPIATFLKSGGPRTTRCQEGLAIFAELYEHVLAEERLMRLANRVRLVAMAEDGAGFLDLYRFLVSGGAAPRDAYFDAQRVCRGGLVSGGAPFTKDAVYLAGLLEVYAFLAAVIRGGFRDEVELVVAGRLALDDIAILAELRAEGLVTRPPDRPRWLARWGTLLPFFAFSSFVSGLDLAPVEAHYDALIRAASAVRRPEGARSLDR